MTNCKLPDCHSGPCEFPDRMKELESQIVIMTEKLNVATKLLKDGANIIERWEKENDALADLVADKDEGLRLGIKIAALQVGIEEDKAIGGWFKTARRLLNKTTPSLERAKAASQVIAAAEICVLPYEHKDHDQDGIVHLGIALDTLHKAEKDAKQYDGKSLIRNNAEKDPKYAPYCLACSRMGRMKKIEPFLWQCKCGARHDERLPHEVKYGYEGNGSGLSDTHDGDVESVG